MYGSVPHDGIYTAEPTGGKLTGTGTGTGAGMKQGRGRPTKPKRVPNPQGSTLTDALKVVHLLKLKIQGGMPDTDAVTMYIVNPMQALVNHGTKPKVPHACVGARSVLRPLRPARS